MRPPRYTFSPPLARATPAALAAGGMAALGLLAWPYTVDDAFIAARYARHVAHGLGYAMNPPEATDGITGPLWLVPQIAAIAFGLDPIAIAKGVGLACTVLAVWLAVAAARERALGRAAAWIAAAVCVLSPSLFSWGIAGLETGLATLLVAIAARSAARAGRPSGPGVGACVGALAWLRPELAFAGAALIACTALRDRRAGGVALGLALGGALGVALWRLALFGDALPLSYRAKAGTLLDGARYTAITAILATSLVGLVLAALGAARGGRAGRILGAALGAHVIAVVLAGGDWMPGYRLLVPLIPIYAQLLALGATRGLLRRPRWLPPLLLALACALPLADLVTRMPELRASADGRPEAQRLAQRLAAHAKTVALVDVGYLGYASDVAVVDLAGLTDPVIARMRGGHLSKRIDPAYLRERAPDALVLHSGAEPRVGPDGELLAFDGYPVERYVAALSFVRSEFRVAAVFRYAPNYHYVLLTRSSGRTTLPTASRGR